MPILGSRGISPRGYGFAGAGKPNAPVSVSATDVGTSRAYNNGAATVSFSSGGDNGAPITSYTVTSSPGGFTATGSSSPLTVTGLQSDVSYTYTVTATNSVGTSDASSASSSVTATTVPQAPTIGTATAGDSSATVAYTAGATGGKAVSAYTATSSPGSFTGTGSSPITVSGLTNGTSYTFTVTATNANGTSSASSASGSITPTSPLSFESIATSTVGGGGTTSVTFSGIPSTYKHLEIRWIARNNSSSNVSDMYVTYNNDGSSNYKKQWLFNFNGTSPAGSTSGGNYYSAGYSYGGDAGVAGVGVIKIFDYQSPNKKQAIYYSGNAPTSASNSAVVAGGGLWLGESAITTITIASSSPTWVANSQFALYGIKG